MWWKRDPKGVEFFDGAESNTTVPGVMHIRSNTLESVALYLQMKWEQCISLETPLPAVEIRTYHSNVDLNQLTLLNRECNSRDEWENPTVSEGEEPTEQQGNPTVSKREELTEQQGNSTVSEREEPTEQQGNSTVSEGEEPTEQQGNPTVSKREELTEKQGNSTVSEREEPTEQQGNSTVSEREEPTEQQGNSTVSEGEEPTEQQGNSTVSKREQQRNPTITHTQVRSTREGNKFHTTLGLQLPKVLKGDSDMKQFDEMRYKLKHDKQRDSYRGVVLRYNTLRVSLKAKLGREIHKTSKTLDTRKSTGKADHSALVRHASHIKRVCNTILRHEWNTESNTH